MWLWIGIAFAGCDAKEVVAGANAIEAAEGDMRVALAAMAFGEACASSPLSAAMRAVANAGPDRRGMLEMVATAENPQRWMEVCGGAAGLRAAADVGAVAASEKRAFLWKTCSLEKTGWMTESEWLGSTGLVFTPFMVGAELKAEGVDAKASKSLVRSLAGVK